VRVTEVRNLSGKIQVIDGVEYKSGAMVPIAVARLPDGRLNPCLGPPPETRKKKPKEGG